MEEELLQGLSDTFGKLLLVKSAKLDSFDDMLVSLLTDAECLDYEESEIRALKRKRLQRLMKAASCEEQNLDRCVSHTLDKLIKKFFSGWSRAELDTKVKNAIGVEKLKRIIHLKQGNKSVTYIEVETPNTDVDAAMYYTPELFRAVIEVDPGIELTEKGELIPVIFSEVMGEYGATCVWRREHTQCSFENNVYIIECKHENVKPELFVAAIGYMLGGGPLMEMEYVLVKKRLSELLESLSRQTR